MKWVDFVLTLLVFSVLFLSPRFDLTRFTENAGHEDGYLMLNVDARVVAGYGSMISSIVWVETIFQFADIVIDKRPSKKLLPLFHLVADLDTLWEYPRLVAAWVVPDLPGNSNKDALPFLIEGANRFPTQWKFRLTWAQYLLDEAGIDSVLARDSAAKILLPLSRSRSEIPDYVRSLAFTLLQRSGKPDEAMDILLQTYEQVPDPLIRFQFQNKIADLLRRNEVKLGVSDSTAFLHAIGGMLDSKDASQIGMAKGLLVRLVQPEHKAAALTEAHQLAEQFKVYQKQAAVGR